MVAQSQQALHAAASDENCYGIAYEGQQHALQTSKHLLLPNVSQMLSLSLVLLCYASFAS